METKMAENPFKVQELLKVVREGVAKVQSSEAWKVWLDASSKFWKYSFHNQMLIRCQRPDASRVAGYQRWLKFGRQVKKGATGIRILAPNTVKMPKKDGEKDDVVSVIRGFRVISVFDISQTEGKELPEIYHPLRGASIDDLVGKLTSFITGHGYTVRIGKTSSADIFGYVNDQKEIVLKEGESPNQQALVLAHEISHAILGHVGSLQNRAEKELEAETSAWIICRNLGLRTDETSFVYLASWVNGPEREKKLEQAATRASRVAEQILSGLESMTNCSLKGDAQ